MDESDGFKVKSTLKNVLKMFGHFKAEMIDIFHNKNISN